MKDMYQQNCPTSRARDDNDDGNDDSNDNNSANFSQITPSVCICTNVYFNLWSACYYTTTGLKSGLPACSSLEQTCAKASFNMTIKPTDTTTYPGWVFTQLPPSNTTWDLAAAVETAKASQPRKWSLVQILVPIIVGLAVATMLVVGFIIYRRRKNMNRQRPWMKTTGDRPRFQFHTMSSRHKVREQNRSTSWSIDEGEENLDEYQFVSYPASLQGSQVSGHVRLSPSSVRHLPGPPMLDIPAKKTTPVWAWPGKSIWKGSLQSAQRMGDSIPRPWRSTRRVAVKTIPPYSRFRVDASDSDSPLSQRPHTESLLGRAGRSRTDLHNETIFEQRDENDSDSDEEALPLIPEEHSRSNHDAEPPANTILMSPTSGADSLGSSQRTARQMPPASAPPSIPLPLPPPTPTQTPPAPPSQQPRAVRPQGSPRPPPPPPPPPISSSSPQSAVRTPRSHPAFPPAPTSPPPPPPTVPRRSPRSPRTPLPAQFSNQEPLPSPPLLSPPQAAPPAPIPPPPRAPRHRPSSDGGSVRSLPMTPTTPTPPYVRATPAPIQVREAPPGNTPPNSAPPYAPAVPPKTPPADTGATRSPSDITRSPSETVRSVRRLPLPPS
ncbi:hypothetical protein B0H19DRAFT_364935 [Mycena capillaripes]|nr:hypothetical protein B0H19DRAFT_364935 [Mycena capillaripes]